jgi:hypothetical protein
MTSLRAGSLRQRRDDQEAAFKGAEAEGAEEGAVGQQVVEAGAAPKRPSLAHVAPPHRAPPQSTTMSGITLAMYAM